MRHWGRRIGLLALFLLGALVTTAITLPARVAWSVAGDIVPVRLHEPEGTVWSGRATGLTYRGTTLHGVEWRIHPAALLGGRLEATLRARGDNGDLAAQLAAAPGGRVEVRDALARLDVDTVLDWARRGGLAFTVDGILDATLRRLVVDGRRPVTADGRLRWESAALNLGERYPLGTLTLDLAPGGNGGIDATLSAEGGVFAVDGEADVAPDGTFRARMEVTPRPGREEAGRALARRLRLANPDGTTVLEANGGPAGIEASQHAGG
ncbi:type II secretion system protein N [Arhodomonas aquaeolei]|uniref:type II secretion system protein N n=1 Tax=Arhodomonas aquaeolei TaxID=2369 RepID=UPI000369D714|nr:type II secretion system protein N [Arhodomonas aquaeolei]